MPLTVIKGVGPQLVGKLEKLGIHSLQGLLLHFPFRYQDRTRITPLSQLQLHQEAVIEGEIKACDIVFGKRRSLLCRLQDKTGVISLRFFHFSMAQKNQLQPGVQLRCFGEVRRGRQGLELYHPEYTIIGRGEASSPESNYQPESTLTPVYPVTEGLQQNRLRKIINQAFDYIKKDKSREVFPDHLLLKPRGMSAVDDWVACLDAIHHPPDLEHMNAIREGTHPLQQHLVFEELLAHHFALLKARKKIQRHDAFFVHEQENETKSFIHTLPFRLTAAQRRVNEEIYADLKKNTPMLRLVQGDVGCGKTLVAAMAVEKILQSGFQAALMAPTELLAEQHYLNFSQWFDQSGFSCLLLTGSTSASARKQVLEALANRQACIVIGTHALFQEGVKFAQLALVIIDEQHRFGVHQRLLLNQKGEHQGKVPHQLVMTATPIPRTLAMSVYADLDYSVIDEMPDGRKPVNTLLIEKHRRQEVIERVAAVCSDHRQVYWVCTLIEASENLQCQAAENTYRELSDNLKAIRVGLVHGRMKTAEKNSVMEDFKNGKIHLLVATTVIEVGVDVANASLMVIENPERLGLAQLHQLRGRVGRGSEQSHCILLYENPLSEYSKARLSIMRETCDGFRIAEEDLRLRGPGEVLGTRQTGEIRFRMADLQRDGWMLNEVKRLAVKYEERHPEVIPLLIDRWLSGSEKFVNA
ncbi:MAG: ATP-dependent DNA helicase RecG [Pseudomonadales bacterium]|nr:ATP-dependent DNA helicase RecG [Pseudomonadales bacterium]